LKNENGQLVKNL